MSIVTHKSGNVNSKFDKISTFFDKFSNEVDNKKIGKFFIANLLEFRHFLSKNHYILRSVYSQKIRDMQIRGLGEELSKQDAKEQFLMQKIGHGFPTAKTRLVFLSVQAVGLFFGLYFPSPCLCVSLPVRV